MKTTKRLNQHDLCIECIAVSPLCLGYDDFKYSKYSTLVSYLERKDEKFTDKYIKKGKFLYSK